MKKIILILTCLLAFLFVDAQTLTSNIRTGQTYVNVNTDITLTNTTPLYWQVNSLQNWYTAQTVIISLVELAGSHTNVEVLLQGRVSEQVSWTDIGTAIDWKLTTSDTVITYTNTTENSYKQFRVLYTGTGTGTTTISRQEFKQYYGAVN